MNNKQMLQAYVIHLKELTLRKAICRTAQRFCHFLRRRIRMRQLGTRTSEVNYSQKSIAKYRKYFYIYSQ